MLDPGLLNDLIELLSSNFRADEINEIGKLLDKDFDSHKILKTENHITLSPRKCAAALAEFCDGGSRIPDLIKLISDIDDGSIVGRRISIEGIEVFLSRLPRFGVYYDFEKRRVVQHRKELTDLPNWGSLKDGREYPITVMSLDIVENSKLVRKNGAKKMEKLYAQLLMFIRSRLKEYDGRIWQFAGDGGIIAFSFEGHVDRAVRCALDIQCTLPIFNQRSDAPVKDPLVLRIALDTGLVRFKSKTGDIISDVINRAAHLEKQATQPGRVTISQSIRKLIDPKLLAAFIPAGEQEGGKFYTTVKKLDTLLDDCENCRFELPAP